MSKTTMRSIKTSLTFVIALMWIYPAALIITNSFKSHNDMMQNFLALPKKIDFAMYVETWIDFEFLMLYKNTFFYTISTVLLIVLFAPMAAYKLARIKSKLSSWIFILIIFPIMVLFKPT